MKKLKWIPLSLNLISLISFALSAILLSTYASGFFLTLEWIMIGFFAFFSILHVLFLLFNDKSIAKDIVYMVVTALKAFMPVLGYCFSFNVGWPFNNSTSLAVIVLSTLTIVTSITELFTDDIFYILSNRNNKDFVDKMASHKKVSIAAIIFYSVIVLLSVFEASVSFISKLGTGIYLLPFLPIGDDMIVDVEQSFDFFWYGFIVLSSILQLAFYLKTRKFKSATLQNVLCVFLAFLGLMAGSELCRIHGASGSTFFGMLSIGSTGFYKWFLKVLAYLMLVAIPFVFIRRSYQEEKTRRRTEDSKTIGE